MPKVTSRALWWQTILRWLDSLIAPCDLRTLIRAHAADALKEARLNGGFIGFESRIFLFGSFLTEHPDNDLGFDEFSAELNRALGRPHRLIPSQR